MITVEPGKMSGTHTPVRHMHRHTHTHAHAHTHTGLSAPLIQPDMQITTHSIHLVKTHTHTDTHTHTHRRMQLVEIKCMVIHIIEPTVEKVGNN